ncbi:MAG: heme a synthase [Acidobacteriota bacterium]|jgi:cytochrome c oxidase assembly protein subunit 15|nr:heme a synthase [Acidobacteriota bacterium]
MEMHEPQNLRVPLYTEQTPRWLRRFTKLVAAATLFLIFAGAMVTSTGSGLAVPDWPLSYGMLMPPMVAGIFYEHGHRMVATTVGILVILQAIWLQRREPRRFVRRLGWLSLAAVICQGLLGGITVLLLLPKAVSISHAALAELFFCINVSIAFFTSNWSRSLGTLQKGDAPVKMAWGLTALVYLQILAGAVMRHLGAGLAIPDFPLSFGRVVPRFVSIEVISAFVHRVGGFVVAAAVIAMAIRLLRYDRNHPLRIIVHVMLLIVAAQVMLGGYVIWSGKQPHITSLHVMTGAFTLALSLWLTLSTRAVAWKKAPVEPANRPSLAASEVTA